MKYLLVTLVTAGLMMGVASAGTDVREILTKCRGLSTEIICLKVKNDDSCRGIPKDYCDIFYVQICLITARRQNLMAGISVNLKMAGVLDLASAVKLNKTEQNRVLPLSCVTKKKVALYKQGV